jgi:hypothetical protein
LSIGAFISVTRFYFPAASSDEENEISHPLVQLLATKAKTTIWIRLAAPWDFGTTPSRIMYSSLRRLQLY